jgi:formylglycine-generating enzyme required for sulfatase activity
MADIPAGPFIFGDKAKEPNENIEKIYRIDVYPVTNREFEAFIREGGYIKNEYWSESGRAWRNQESITEPGYLKDEKWNQPDHPVVGVSFYEAEAYAKFRGKRLPSEKEWERAARGTHGGVYPWGDEFDREKCNTSESLIGQTTPVTKYPNGISPEGCYDMAGNVREWTASHYDKDTYVLRGGSWYDFLEDARCAYRGWYNPDFRLRHAGFRCAGSLD